MKILYDGFIYRDQNIGGINRYFENIISRLDDKDMPILLRLRNEKIQYPSHYGMQTYYANKFHFRPGRVAASLNRLNMRFFSHYIKPDLAHPTFFRLLTEQEISAYECPVVITVHDMTSELFPNLADPNGREARLKKKAVKAADAIICVSENTKSDLLRFYPEVVNRVTVIHHGVDLKPQLVAEPIGSTPYFLFVGSRFPYKNFDFLLKAFSKLISKRPDISLSVVGEPFSFEELQLIGDLKLSESINHHGFVDDMFLAALYSHSVAFVYPSLYEGFGISILEAMACGTPVIAANASCFPEVAGNAAILFDLESKDNLVDAMLMVIDNPSCRDALITEGYRHSSHFTWEKTAKATNEIYRSLVT